MKNTRVVITGLGTVNAISLNVRDFSAALRQGKSGIGPVTLFDSEGHMTSTAAEVKDFDPEKVLVPDLSFKRVSRADLLGLTAGYEALKDAGLFPPPEALALETAVIIGGGAGGLLEAEEFYADYLAGSVSGKRFSRLAPVYCASTADLLCTRLGLWGPKATFMTACSSGATAVGYGRDLIAGGLAKVVLAGGTEPLCRMTYTAFNALRAVDPEYCKPFDKNRRGLTLGEGAGFLVLESLDQALERGAAIYAEVLGYGLSADAHHMTAPAPDGRGAVLAMKAAIEDAGISLDKIGYINAHGTATPANDAVESKAIKEVFGPAAYDIPVSSTKSMIGHTLGAAGALEAVVSVLVIRDNFIPPTIHHEEPDPECDLDYVSSGAREAVVEAVLSNSFAFGGNNTALVLGRYRGEGA